jgi:hypothetical protein
MAHLEGLELVPGASLLVRPKLSIEKDIHVVKPYCYL